jgi:hypothetical protein
MKTLDREILLLELQRDSVLIVTLPIAVKYKGAVLSDKCIDGGGLHVETSPMPLMFDAGDQIKVRVLEHEQAEGIIDVEIVTCEYNEYDGALAVICLADVKVAKYFYN